jgi:hypothetical protein
VSTNGADPECFVPDPDPNIFSSLIKKDEKKLKKLRKGL